MTNFAVEVIPVEASYNAICPDVPGIVSARDTVEEVVDGIRSCLNVLFELIRRDGGEYPIPRTTVAFVELDPPAGSAATIELDPDVNILSHPERPADSLIIVGGLMDDLPETTLQGLLDYAGIPRHAS